MTASTHIPIGDGSGDGSASRRCPVCNSPLPSRRAGFCSGTCRMRAHRRRHSQPDLTHPVATLPPAWPQIFECPECEQRYLGVRRCPECNLYCRRLGAGGLCSHCDEPILLSDLLGPTDP